MAYQKIDIETKRRLETYLRSKEMTLQGRGNLNLSPYKKGQVTFDRALDLLLKEVGF